MHAATSKPSVALKALLCGGIAVFGHSAMAQTPAPAAPVKIAVADEAKPEGLGDIVVTARFRKENLQSTPLSVSALDASKLETFVVVDVQSIQRFLPNVQLSRINFSGNALGASIRGVSFADLEKPSIRQSASPSMAFSSAPTPAPTSISSMLNPSKCCAVRKARSMAATPLAAR